MSHSTGHVGGDDQLSNMSRLNDSRSRDETSCRISLDGPPDPLPSPYHFPNMGGEDVGADAQLVEARCAELQVTYEYLMSSS